MTTSLHPSSRCRFVFVLLGLAAFSCARATDSAIGGWPAPLVPPTNAASATFLDSHPELESPPSTVLDHEVPPPAPSETSPVPPPPFPSAPEPSGSAPPEANSASHFHFFFPEGNPDQFADHLLVVYNSAEPDSKILAQYYANRRAIPPERVLGIACPTSEEISRDQYNNAVREPIISYIYTHGWMTRTSVTIHLNGSPLELLVANHNDVWGIVLIRGIPLKIANDSTITDSMQPGGTLQVNAAAVDSELALLPIYGLPLGGFVPNIFYDAYNTANIRVGPELASKLILVTRLDGPTAADVRRMIDDTLYAEQHRLAGTAVIDTRGLTDSHNPYTMGDTWLRTADDLLLKAGWPVTLDAREEVLPSTVPCNHVGLYLGWYTADATGPWITPPDRFVPGAIAYHLHSFSASSVRGGSAWVANLVAHGADATMGTVYEPYLDLTPHIDIFTRHLLAGNYFAEAAYASERALSWMFTVIGDPLYRPFREPLDTAIANSGPPSSDHFDALRVQQVRLDVAAGRIPATIDGLEDQLNLPGAVAQEALGDMLGKMSDSGAIAAQEQAYRRADGYATQPIDHIRIGLKLAYIYENHDRHRDALAEYKKLHQLYPDDASSFAVPQPPSSNHPHLSIPLLKAPAVPRPPTPPTPSN